MIRRQSRHSRFIRFEQPHLPQVKILYQFLILISHILRPNNVGSINVSPVVNPFVNRIVTGTVTNNDEMPATHMAEAFQDFGTLPVPGVSIGTPRHSEILGANAKETHGKTRDANDGDECSSQVSTSSPPLPKVAQPLNDDGVNDTSWFYVQWVLVPYQKADAAAHGRPRGNLSDLYPRWLGTRELLLHHRDPYSSEVTREIQSGYYGRPLDPRRMDDPRFNEPKDQQGFAYPLHVIFLLAPTIGLPFPVVQAGFRWLLVTLMLASVLLWLWVLRWRPSAATTAIIILLTLGSYAVVQGIKLQQLTLVVSALLAGCAAALVAGHFSLAGFLLALATIKPQLALPLAGWLTLWAASDWRRRQSFIWSFALSMATFLAASEYILPGWMKEFRDAVAAYRQYTGGAGSLLDVLTTPCLETRPTPCAISLSRS